MNLRLPADVQYQLKLLAFQSGVSMTQHIIQAVQAYLARRP